VAPTAKVIGQFGPGPMEPRLDGPNGAIDRLADFLIGQAIFVEEHKDQSVVGSESFKGPLQLPRKVVWVGQPRARVAMVFNHLNAWKTPPASGQNGTATIRGDTQEPRSQRPSAVKPAYSADRSQESLLQYVLGILPMSQHAHAHAKEQALKPLYETRDCVGMIRLERAHQVAVIAVHVLHRGQAQRFWSFHRGLLAPAPIRFSFSSRDSPC
jgi:hypothetical protein